MTEEQFNCIARLTKSRGGASQNAAYDVLINGLTVAVAARKNNIHYNSVDDAVKRYDATLELIQSIDWA